jgi:hypothetical protein
VNPAQATIASALNSDVQMTMRAMQVPFVAIIIAFPATAVQPNATVQTNVMLMNYVFQVIASAMTSNVHGLKTVHAMKHVLTATVSPRLIRILSVTMTPTVPMVSSAMIITASMTSTDARHL